MPKLPVRAELRGQAGRECRCRSSAGPPSGSSVACAEQPRVHGRIGRVQSESRRRVRRQGPATLRGDFIPNTTTDQRLLDRRGPGDWVHTDPWRVLRIQAEFVEGFGLLAELGQAVSIFGSARTSRLDAAYGIAEAVAAGLARAGYAVITGGGPGIMEAANKGASEAGG